MSAIERLFVAMTTRDSDDAGTDSDIMLIGNVNGIDRLQYTFPDTAQKDQERGHANLYNFTVSIDLDSTMLPSTYFRVAIRGEDAWRPEHFFLWGTKIDFTGIVPIAFRFDLTTQSVERLVDGVGQRNTDISEVVLSTDNDEGDLSFPLLPVSVGDEATKIKRLLLLMTTADQDDAGTDDTITLKISQGPAFDVLPFEFPDTSQDDQKRAQANWYFVPVVVPIIKNRLGTEESIHLLTDGDDAWHPESFFIFGLDTVDNMPTSIVPLVHMQTWTKPALSKDFNEGHEQVSLTVAR